MTVVLDRPSPVAPDRMLAQRNDALIKANWTRSKRAELKRDLKAGRVSVASLLASPPEWLETCKVIDLLLATPKWGRVKAAKALRAAGVSPSKTISGLTARQRTELIGWLR